MAKIALIISRNEYLRNYLDSGALQHVRAKHEVTLFLAPELKVDSTQKTGFHTVKFLPTLLNASIGQFIFDLYMIRYRNRSSSFRYRIKRKFPSIYWQLIYLISHRSSVFASTKISINAEKNQMTVSSFASSNSTKVKFRHLKVAINLLKSLLKGKGKKFLYFVLASRLLFRLTTRILRRQTLDDLKSLDIFRDFSAVLIPSSAYEYHSSLVIRNTMKSKTKSILLVDNWDNLSSKSVLWEKPDVLGCWGEQSKEHAIEIQRMPESSVIPIGTPRIDPYFNKRIEALPSNFNFKYILFLGSSVPYDEAGFLKKLDYEISNNPEIYQGARIIYRPHPLRGGWEAADISKLSATLLDPDVEEAYLSGAIRWNSNAKLPPLDNYPSLLANSEMVVSGLTSMIFEASIFGKYCVGLAFDEKRNLTNPKKLRREYLHFHGIDELPNLDLSSDQLIAIEKIRNFFLLGKFFNQRDIDQKLKYFLYHDEIPYSMRLCNLVQSALRV